MLGHNEWKEIGQHGGMTCLGHHGVPGPMCVGYPWSQFCIPNPVWENTLPGLKCDVLRALIRFLRFSKRWRTGVAAVSPQCPLGVTKVGYPISILSIPI